MYGTCGDAFTATMWLCLFQRVHWCLSSTLSRLELCRCLKIMKRIKQLFHHKEESAPTYAQPLELLLERDQAAWKAKQRINPELQSQTLSVPLIVYEFTKFLSQLDIAANEGILRLTGSLKVTQDIRNAYEKCTILQLVLVFNIT